jgi:curved DNA-binding protein CbpA
MKKNPFEVFGITPEMVKQLDDDQLFKLVQSNYRFLQKIYHPDVVGPTVGTKRGHRLATQINRAFEKLDRRKNGETFHQFREEYEARLKKGFRKRIEDQERQMAVLTELLGDFAHHSMQFLLHYLEDWERARRNGQSGENSVSIFSLKNVMLGIYDMAVGYNLRNSPWNLGKNYKEICIDGDGDMSYRLLNRKQFSPVKFIRLLGTIKTDKVDLVPLLNKRLAKAATFSGNRIPVQYANGGDMFEVTNTMDLNVFQENCIPFLHPTISENAYLFSFHLEKSNSTLLTPPSKVWVEGKIIKITSLTVQH